MMVLFYKTNSISIQVAFNCIVNKIAKMDTKRFVESNYANGLALSKLNSFEE